MNKLRCIFFGGILCSAFFCLTGCASSELVDVWKDPSYQSRPLEKLLVISVGRNSTQRRIWEDTFTQALAKHNVAATPSYSAFPQAIPDTDQVAQFVQSGGFDGVIVSRRAASETQPLYMQGYVTREETMRYDPRRARFITYIRDIQHAGYVDSQKVDIRVIDLWSTQADGQLIWSATSKTPEPSSLQEVRPEIVDLVLAELTKNKIIAPER